MFIKKKSNIKWSVAVSYSILHHSIAGVAVVASATTSITDKNLRETKMHQSTRRPINEQLWFRKVFTPTLLCNDTFDNND